MTFSTTNPTNSNETSSMKNNLAKNISSHNKSQPQGANEEKKSKRDNKKKINSFVRIRYPEVGEVMSHFNDDWSRYSVEQKSYQLLQQFNDNIDLDLTEEYKKQSNRRNSTNHKLETRSQIHEYAKDNKTFISMSEFMGPISSGRNSGQIVNKSLIQASSANQNKNKSKTNRKPVNLVPLAKNKISKTLNYGRSNRGEDQKDIFSLTTYPNDQNNPAANEKTSNSFSVSRKDKNHQNNSFNGPFGASPSRSFTPEDTNNLPQAIVSKNPRGVPIQQYGSQAQSISKKITQQKKNKDMLKISNHRAVRQKTVLLQIVDQWNNFNSAEYFEGSEQEQNSLKMTLLKDLEQILDPNSSKIYHIRLGVQITNVSNFTWPAGLRFKLLGLKKEVISFYDLKKTIESGENTTIIWELTNREMSHEDFSGNALALVKVLKWLENETVDAKDGFKLNVKCTFNDIKTKFFCQQMLDWKQFHIHYELEGSEEEFQNVVEFVKE